MDYCHPCRRHLNGALVCAGCGTPADEVPQPPVDRPRRPGSVQGFTADAGEGEVMELAQLSPRRASARRDASTPSRAAARRSRAGRGRKALLGGVGLALVAGAFGFSELSDDGGGAATAVKEETRTETEPAPEPSTEGEPPKQPAEVIERPVASGARLSQRPTDPTGRIRTERGGGPSMTGPASRSAVSPSPPTPAPRKPSATASPSGSGKPGRPRISPPPLPEPTPSESCERFLWWCV